MLEDHVQVNNDVQVNISPRDTEKPIQGKQLRLANDIGAAVLSKTAIKSSVNLQVYTKSALGIQLHPNSEQIQKINISNYRCGQPLTTVLCLKFLRLGICFFTNMKYMCWGIQGPKLFDFPIVRQPLGVRMVRKIALCQFL